MLWPFVLPLEITFCVLTGLVALLTAGAPIVKLKRAQVFAVSSFLASLVFIPACLGIKAIVDAHRFGIFHYDSFSDVKDFRVEQFLPTRARDITVEKNAMGHRARYSLSESDLTAYLDQQWDKYGEYSVESRDQMHDRESVSLEVLDDIFGDLGWPTPEDLIQLHSPVESNGGGATYYLDSSTGTVFHRARYW